MSSIEALRYHLLERAIDFRSQQISKDFFAGETLVEPLSFSGMRANGVYVYGFNLLSTSHDSSVGLTCNRGDAHELIAGINANHSLENI
ncbi:MAG: hypothetical protein H6658_09430 [Ardenticatenaceae bacterium]|nr:hypothetical protein [Ardenticatenaceae bacterium]